MVEPRALGVRRRDPAVLVGVLLTATLVGLRLEFHHYAGALWRDEVTGVNVASLSPYRRVLESSHFDSFPYLWATLLHVWVNVIGGGDGALRLVGLLVGLATLPVLWWSGRRLGLEAPLLTLLLFGMSPSVIVYASSVRGYGMGALVLVWCAGTMWAFVRAPGRRTFVLAALAVFLSVLSYLPNGVLLAAIGMGGAAVCLRERAWRTLAGLIALGGVAVAGLAAAVPWVRYAYQVARLEQGDWPLASVVGVFRGALGSQVRGLAPLWAIAAALALIGSGAAWWSRPDPDGDADRGRALFATVTALAALVGYFAYAKLVARLPTQYWYYLSLMGLLALCIDVGVDCAARRLRYGRLARTTAVASVALLLAPAVASTVRVRMTNVDVIAREVAELARPNDLVVVLPWVVGITFQRYYRGDAPWITFPEVEDHRFHVHLLVAEKMKLGDAGVAPELARIARTLQDGGRVWVVGRLRAPSGDEAPPSLPPAPAGPEGWRAGPYLDGWELQLGALLKARTEVWNVEVPGTEPVNMWEVPPLLKAEGWRSSR